MTKRSWIVVLIGINLILSAVLILCSYTPPQAFAQGLNRGGEYLLISARAEQSNDAIYLLDLRTRQLHAFRSNFPRTGGEPARVTLRASRDLIRDFGG